MATYTITGEAGKRLDATVRSLAAMRATGARLRFASMAEDEFSAVFPAAPPVVCGCFTGRL